MGFFGSNFEGENKWFSIYTITLYAFIPLSLWLQAIGKIIWLPFIFIFYTICFYFLKYRLKMQKYEAIQGIVFIEANVVRDNKFRQLITFGIEKVSELKLSDIFVDKEGILDIEDMEEYQLAKERIISELEERENPLLSRVEKRDDGTIVKINEPNPASFIEENQSEKFRMEVKHALFKEAIEDLHAYIIKLYEPKSFADQEKYEFEKMILICYGEYDSNIKPQKDWLNVKGYPVQGQLATATFVIVDYVAIDFPILFLRFSESEAFRMTYHVLEAQKIVFIRDLIMRRLIYDYRSFFKRFESELAEEEALTISYKEKSSKLFQMLKYHTATTLKGGEQVIQQEKPTNGLFVKWWGFGLLLLGWLGFIVMLIMYIISVKRA